MQGKTTPQGSLLRTLKVTRLRRYTLLLAVALSSLCAVAMECGEAADVNFGYSYTQLMAVPQWAPDGSRIVAELSGIIYVVDTDGSTLKALNDEAGKRYRDAHSPSLSPDGSHVVYSQRLMVKPPGFADSRLDYELVVSDIDGSSKRRLTESIGPEIAPAWSPDGRRIAFLSGYAAEFTLFTMAPDGSDVKSLAPEINVFGHGTYPVWSPDGRKIAFLSSERLPEGGFKYGIYVVGSDGSELKRLSETISLPAWSPDSNRIALAKDYDRDYDTIGLFIVDVDGSESREVRRVSAQANGGRRGLGLYKLDWTADGSEIRFGSYPFIVVKVDGSAVESNIHLYPEKATAVWSPDGSRIAVNPQFQWDDSASDRDQEVRLFTMAPDGSDKRVLIRASSGKNIEGKGEQWSPDYARGQ